MRVVVMGVAGSGKTTVGRALADRIGARFLDGDSLHVPAAVAKMSAGQSLTDADRWPWLERIAGELDASGAIVVACSALRRSYRDRLRRAAGVRFVFLDLDEHAARRRLERRPGHFMGPQMVGGQFATLERPERDETDVATVDATGEVAATVTAAVEALGVSSPAPTRSAARARRSRTAG